jgi:iron complex outermembrane receptor protein
MSPHWRYANVGTDPLDGAGERADGTGGNKITTPDGASLKGEREDMKKLHFGTAAAIMALAVLPVAASAQDGPPPVHPSDQPSDPAQPVAGATDAEQGAGTAERAQASDALMNDVVITGTKKAGGENIIQAPISMTAFGSDQLEALQFRSLESLTYSIPNVQLDQLGTFKGVANFTIRGFGVNSSTPSVDPAVGTFIDGVYLGVNFGVVVDTFDVESIEVLRGPQSVLFGRNVTGGAVLIRTARPDGRTRAHLRATIEDSRNQVYAASVEGALVPDVLFGKVTGYLNHDNGYYFNRTYSRHVGRSDTWFIRPTLVLKPAPGVKLTLIGETFKVSGEGPVARNPKYAPPFQTTENEIGLSYLRENSITLESVFNVGPGDGQITDIANYREIKQRNRFDLDAQQADTSIVQNYLAQNQKSNELRYSARLFDRVDLVTGIYLFQQHMLYIERDTNKPLATPVIEGGGQTDQKSIGIFANADISITDQLVLGLGGRYSHDKKTLDINFRARVPQPCDVVLEVCTSFPIHDQASFSSFVPKITLKYEFGPRAQIYALYTKGYRSGGFNLKAQSVGAAAPFRDEKTDDWEAGFKAELFDRRVRVNGNVFYTRAHDLQRQGTFNLPTGPLSLVGNGADAEIKGVEGDITVKVARGLVLNATLGVTDGHYTKVTADLNGDGRIDNVDLHLKIARLAPVTWGVGAYYDTEIAGAGTFGIQGTFNHRDGSFFNDPNTGALPAFDDLAGNISFSPAAFPQAKLTIYGKNLLNRENTGNNSPLPAFQGGGAIWFPTKGRVFGAELDLRF